MNLEKAIRICDAGFGNVQRWDGATMEYVASHKTPPAFAEARQRIVYRPDPELFISRMLKTKSVVQIADAASEQAYIDVPAYPAVWSFGCHTDIAGVRCLTARDYRPHMRTLSSPARIEKLYRGICPPEFRQAN
jgi:hypothetical protein